MSGPRDSVREPGGAPPPDPEPGATARVRPDLRSALRTARVEDAERARAIADGGAVALARLEILRDALEPVFAQVPPDVDLFDPALVPGPRPRLFVDMIAFVEMEHDRRRYRFVQDTRNGRVTLCESDRVGPLCEAVTAYVARRLVEREKALASAGEPPPAFVTPPDPGPLRRAGRLALEYLGIVALVVLLWVLGDAVYHWAARR